MVPCFQNCPFMHQHGKTSKKFDQANFQDFLQDCCRYSSDSFLKNSRLFQDLVIDKLHNVPVDSMCASACTKNTACKSLNYNSKSQICELLLSDIVLLSDAYGKFESFIPLTGRATTDIKRKLKSSDNSSI